MDRLTAYVGTLKNLKDISHEMQQFTITVTDMPDCFGRQSLEEMLTVTTEIRSAMVAMATAARLTVESFETRPVKAGPSTETKLG